MLQSFQNTTANDRHYTQNSSGFIFNWLRTRSTKSQKNYESGQFYSTVRHCIRNPYARIFDSAIYDLRCAYSGVFDIMVFTASSQFLLNIILTESMSFYVNLFVI
jgi:uncharacterized UPF0160 family protein